MSPANYQRFTDVLVLWRAHYQNFTAHKPVTFPSWAAAQTLIRSVESLDQYAREHLQGALIRSSEQLAPLRDPLTLNLGEHRWLSTDREESYSDWLAWILQGIGGATEMLPLFGFDEESLIDELGPLKHHVARERAGRHGRTDIEVRFGTRGLLVIEVKIQPPGTGLLSQLKRYERWAEGQREAIKRFTYLGIETPDEDIRPFSFIAWQTLCCRLRRYAKKMKDSDLMGAAAVLIFCGAVEKNLLGISDRPLRFRASASFDYLASWGDYER